LLNRLERQLYKKAGSGGKTVKRRFERSVLFPFFRIALLEQSLTARGIRQQEQQRYEDGDMKEKGARHLHY
jgi:hypothetical protein